MIKKNEIYHEGIINNISKDTINVNIISKASCISCQLKSVCSASDIEEKTIEIPNIYNNNYSIGDKVNIILKESLGLKALFLGYLLPFIIVFTTLLIASALTKNELKTGLVSILILIPYYIILYLIKPYLKKTFTYKLENNY